MKTQWVLELLLMSLFSCCCSGLGETWIDVNEMVDVSEGVGRALVLNHGDFLRVTLKSNPTTGYSWVKTVEQEQEQKKGQEHSSDAFVIRQLGPPVYTQNPSPRGMTGVGGKEVFRFKAVASGKVVLKFAYARPWEKGLVSPHILEWPITVT